MSLKIKVFSHTGSMLRSLILSVMLVAMMSMSAFADVTVTKEWEDGLTGTAASSREAPSVSLEGSTPYEQLLNLMYPVGCYFETSDISFDPNVAWGGTWTKENDGRVLVSANSTYPIGSTGGEATHKLTVAEMPSHNHSVVGNITHSDGTYISAGEILNAGIFWGAGRNRYNLSCGNAGGNEAHNNMQPYKAVNRWHRTA